jgi:hypothetical protein
VSNSERFHAGGALGSGADTEQCGTSRSRVDLIGFGLPVLRRNRPVRAAQDVQLRPGVRGNPVGSGMASVVESITWTNPGGSPLGDASSRPSASHVAMTTKGERSMSSRAVV